MKPIATLDQALGQVAKLTRLLHEAGLPDDAYQWPIDHRNIRQNLVEYWKSLDPSLHTKVTQASMKSWLTPESLEGQIITLAQEFNLSLDRALAWRRDVLPNMTLPLGCYWAAFPSQHSLVRVSLPQLANPDRDIHELVTKSIFNALSRKMHLACGNGDILTHENLKIDERTARALDFLERDQPGDIWILPCQLGWNNAGKSVKAVRDDFRHPEFGLPAWMVAVQLFVHHEQISEAVLPFINCPGDCIRSSFGDFSTAPLFGFGVGRVGFFPVSFGYANDDYGSASAFLPQVTLDSI